MAEPSYGAIEQNTFYKEAVRSNHVLGSPPSPRTALRGGGAIARSSLYKMKAKEPKTKPDEAIVAADSDRERSHSPVMLSAIHTLDIKPHDASSISQYFLSICSILRQDIRVLAPRTRNIFDCLRIIDAVAEAVGSVGDTETRFDTMDPQRHHLGLKMATTP